MSTTSEFEILKRESTYSNGDIEIEYMLLAKENYIDLFTLAELQRLSKFLIEYTAKEGGKNE